MTALSRRNFITAAAATAVAATATPAVATEVSPVACDALEPAEWMNACYYMGGDICRHGGKRWFALRNHTSGDFFTLRKLRSSPPNDLGLRPLGKNDLGPERRIWDQ